MRLRLAIAISLCTAAAWAQINTASVAGAVTDATGASIPHASLAITDATTGLKVTSPTDDAGQYAFRQLDPADYSLTVTADGFKRLLIEHIALHAGDNIRQNYVLQVGEISQVIPVEAAVGLLETESAEIRDLIENPQVLALPLKDHQFLELALLSEGVVNPPGGTRGDSLQQTGKLINIFGQRTGHNLFMVDGTSVTDEYYNNVVLNPSPDDVQEFEIYKTNYSPEFGGKSAGVINVVTRSGGDRFHGNVHEFLRNNTVDARNFFAPAGQPTPFRENQFGGALGGPITK